MASLLSQERHTLRDGLQCLMHVNIMFTVFLSKIVAGGIVFPYFA